MPSPTELAGLVEEIAPRAIELRRLLHQHPEPAHQEYQTTALIVKALEAEGVSVHTREPATGLWVDIGDQPAIGFRADIDALPITEPQENIARSENAGWMHASGHDAHSAIAFGIAVAMHRIDPSIGARIIFQPAEETSPGGASHLVAEGLVDGLKGLMAFHVDPALEVGRLGARVGIITGSADVFSIRLQGPGGHTSRPHKTIDLVDAGARVVRGLPKAIRESFDARIPIVTAFGSIQGGNAANVIPTDLVITGTVRTTDRSSLDVLPELVDRELGIILAETGADYSLDYSQAIAPVVNDEGIVDTVSRATRIQIGDDSVVETETSMGGEVFSAYLDIVPGALFRLGAYSGGGDLHSVDFKVNETAIAFGIEAGVASLIAMSGAR